MNCRPRDAGINCHGSSAGSVCSRDQRIIQRRTSVSLRDGGGSGIQSAGYILQTAGPTEVLGDSMQLSEIPVKGPWGERHLLGLEKLSAEQILTVLDLADYFDRVTHGGTGAA